jgi:hypothetical protein
MSRWPSRNRVLTQTLRPPVFFLPLHQRAASKTTNMRTAKSSHAPASTHAESPPEFRPHPLRNNSPLSLPFPEKVLIANPASTCHPPPPPITRKVFRTPRPPNPRSPPNIVHPLNRHSPASDPPPSSAPSTPKCDAAPHIHLFTPSKTPMKNPPFPQH